MHFDRDEYGIPQLQQGLIDQVGTGAAPPRPILRPVLALAGGRPAAPVALMSESDGTTSWRVDCLAGDHFVHVEATVPYAQWNLQSSMRTDEIDAEAEVVAWRRPVGEVRSVDIVNSRGNSTFEDDLLSFDIEWSIDIAGQVLTFLREPRQPARAASEALFTTLLEATSRK